MGRERNKPIESQTAPCRRLADILLVAGGDVLGGILSAESFDNLQHQLGA